MSSRTELGRRGRRDVVVDVVDVLGRRSRNTFQINYNVVISAVVGDVTTSSETSRRRRRRKKRVNKYCHGELSCGELMFLSFGCETPDRLSFTRCATPKAPVRRQSLLSPSSTSSTASVVPPVRRHSPLSPAAMSAVGPVSCMLRRHHLQLSSTRRLEPNGTTPPSTSRRSRH